MVSLQELNVGTVAEKDYLNPVCGTITCDTLIANTYPNIFNQSLNTTDLPTFARLNIKRAEQPFAGAGIDYFYANGTLASPTAVVLGKPLSENVYYGYNGSAYVFSADMACWPLENWAVGATGSMLEFYTTPIGSSSMSSILTLRQDGSQVNSKYTINNTTASTSTTTGSLIVKGGCGIAGSLNVAGTINDLTAGGGAFAQTNTVTVVNTVVETALTGTGVGSLSVPANKFGVGGSYIAEAGGVMSCLNNETLTIRIYGGATGTTLLGTIPTLTIPTSTGKWWGVAMYFTVRTLGIATVASLSVRATYTQNVDTGNNLFGSSFHTVNTTTFDTTILNTLRITAQWGSASASNTIAMAQCVLTKSF